MKDKHVGSIVLDESKIEEGVNIVASMLNKDYDDAVIITVVPGGIFYTADLTRKLNFPINMDYISCPHTPGDRNNNSTIVYHQNINIKDRHVIIIDDAIESGGTMKRIVEHIKENFNSASVSVAILLVKPSRVDIPVKQYYAYEMDNDNPLIGYGMPWEGKYRNQHYISNLLS